MKKMKKNKENKDNDKFDKLVVGLLILVVVLMAFNQVSVLKVSAMVGGSKNKNVGMNLDNVDLSEIKSTGHSVAALFPVQDIKTTQDAVDIMISVGTPDYGPALGVSYDDPILGLSILMKLDNSVQLTAQENERYLNIVTKPLGISCEFCCGVGAVGVDKNGKGICGCQHNPALLGLTKWLIQNTDYSDGEIVREALRWKTLFFPKDMVNLALTVAGGDTSQLDELPGIVGGC